MKKIKTLKVFIASPGDVAEEREIVRKVCEELNKTPPFKKTYNTPAGGGSGCL